MKYLNVIIALTIIACINSVFSSEGGEINKKEAIIEKLTIDNKHGCGPSISDGERIVIEKIKQLVEAKEYIQALQILEKAITDESSPALFIVKGNVYIKDGEFEKAAIELEKTLDIYPNYLLVQKTLGFLYTRMEKFDKARKHLLRAIELGGEDGRLYGLVGYTYQLDEEWFIAEMFFREAYKRDSVEPEWKDSLNRVIEEQNKVRSVRQNMSG